MLTYIKRIWYACSLCMYCLPLCTFWWRLTVSKKCILIIKINSVAKFDNYLNWYCTANKIPTKGWPNIFVFCLQNTKIVATTTTTKKDIFKSENLPSDLLNVILRTYKVQMLIKILISSYRLTENIAPSCIWFYCCI